MLGHETSTRARFYGKYRGIVQDNKDPMMVGRLQVKVPEVMGDQVSGWALPCFPYVGDGEGFHMVPPVDAGVWVEFEAGDASRPIWCGGWFGDRQAPDSPLPEKKILKSGSGHVVLLDDTTGAEKIEIKHKAGAKVVLEQAKVEIADVGGSRITIEASKLELSHTSGGKITIDAAGITLAVGGQQVKVSQANVSINNGALEVM